jgi:glycosyltransferase involved in cell wall biosynthesis
MRVLILHSQYRSGEVSGENRVVADEARLLREGGHQVDLWRPVPAASGPIGLLTTGARAIWSRTASRRVREMIRRTRPDIVHLHNLFPELSPAVLRATQGAGAVVMTLHNYRTLCLPATFVRDGAVCEDCLGRAPWPGVIHACYRDSRAGSAAVATSLVTHRALGTFLIPDRYLAVSEFVKAKHVQAGWSSDRIAVRSNFSWPSRRRQGAGEYFLYAGRLSSEKGVATIVEAFEGLSAPLVIAGDGPDGPNLRAASRAETTTFLGSIPASEVGAVVARARAVLVPSRCYEGQPRGILEAYAAGVPVIASDIGGLPEVVQDGVTGALVSPASLGGWREAVGRLLVDQESERLGAAAWDLWRERFSPERGLVTLESQYEQALQAARP